MADDCKACKRRAAKDERDKIKRVKAERVLRERIAREVERDRDRLELECRLGFYGRDLLELEERMPVAEARYFRALARSLYVIVPRNRAELIRSILMVHVVEADRP